MIQNLLDKVGDWNPQLMRELKGRLKIFYVAIAVIISLVGQVILFLYQLQYLPGDNYSLTGKYCHLSQSYINQRNVINSQINSLRQQLTNAPSTKSPNPELISDLQTKLQNLDTQRQSLSNFLRSNYCPTDQINMQMWLRDYFENIFLSLSVAFIFILLVGGTYLLINNLAQEEKRGTLNFIRLSPQSENSILIGKILGVPILVYTAFLIAIPLHFLAGHLANIATSYILIFYTILVACCIFFYSLALLFGLFSSYLSSFQPWLGAGVMLFFLFITMQLASDVNHYNNAAVWLRLLSPFDMTKYLFKNLFSSYKGQSNLGTLTFFYLPIGKTLFGLAATHLLNYGFWNYWVWQGIKRRFHNPNATLLSKKNSYLFVAGCQIILWGFTLQPHVDKYCDTPYKCQYKSYYELNTQVSNNFPLIILFNVLLLFVLLAIISPHRQAIQDWARYRYERFNSLLQDVIWAEKSPAHIAMLINLLLVTIPMFTWIIIAPALNFNGVSPTNWWIENTGRLRAILSLMFLINLMMIYSTIAQRMLMMKSNKRSLWAVSTIGALMLLPPIVLGLLRIYPEKYPTVWLFSTFPWAGLEDLVLVSVFSALIFEFGVLVLLNFNLHHQIKLAGESASKALMSKD
ncbi:MAG: ABC transporter permease subunit [Calothrix sp. MO_192.B10]|nr:ABC transporter permease subunit [Calothrix sp. MO_192.B10]